VEQPARPLDADQVFQLNFRVVKLIVTSSGWWKYADVKNPGYRVWFAVLAGLHVAGVDVTTARIWAPTKGATIPS
jgi:hypothetical protein